MRRVGDSSSPVQGETRRVRSDRDRGSRRVLRTLDKGVSVVSGPACGQGYRVAGVRGHSSSVPPLVPPRTTDPNKPFVYDPSFKEVSRSGRHDRGLVPPRDLDTSGTVGVGWGGVDPFTFGIGAPSPVQRRRSLDRSNTGRSWTRVRVRRRCGMGLESLPSGRKRGVVSVARGADVSEEIPCTN